MDVSIDLTLGPVLSDVPGHPRWTRVDVNDTFLEVVLTPTDEFPDGFTLQIDGQVQSFWFRKGRAEDDTLSTSLTAENLYIVEWRDRGANSGSLNSQSAPLSIQNTWGRIKTLFR
jgi:hypothetical protein